MLPRAHGGKSARVRAVPQRGAAADGRAGGRTNRTNRTNRRAGRADGQPRPYPIYPQTTKWAVERGGNPRTMHNFRQSAIGDAAGHSLPLLKYLLTVGCQADPARGKPNMLYHRNQNDYSIIYNAVNRNNLTTMSWILVQPNLPVRDTDFPSCKNFMEVGGAASLTFCLYYTPRTQELRQELDCYA